MSYVFMPTSGVIVFHKYTCLHFCSLQRTFTQVLHWLYNFEALEYFHFMLHKPVHLRSTFQTKHMYILKYIDITLAHPCTGGSLCPPSFTPHEWAADIFIFITAADTTASPVDLFGGGIAFGESSKQNWMLMRDLTLPWFMQHNTMSTLFPKQLNNLRSVKSLLCGVFI